MQGTQTLTAGDDKELNPNVPEPTTPDTTASTLGSHKKPKPNGHRSNQPHKTAALTSLLPFAWLAVGPVTATEDFADPLTAFGGIQDIAAGVPDALSQAVLEITAAYREQRGHGLNHSEANKLLANANASQPNITTQALLDSFPSERGVGGRTVWAVGFLNDADLSVGVNFTEAALQAHGPQSYVAEPLPASGWAFSDFVLDGDTTVLARCTDYFMLDKMQAIWPPDSYDDGRAVHVFHLQAGKHRIFVRFQDADFKCDLFADSIASRENITGVINQSGEASPLMILSDSVISDVVEGRFPSPYVGIPLLNVAKASVRLHSAELVRAPGGLSVELVSPANATSIASGQVIIQRLMLRQKAPLACDSNNTVLNLTLMLHPMGTDGQKMPASVVKLAATCWASRVGGYKVTFPDYDRSIQHMWVAPPDVSKLEGGRCLKNGCPIMLSLHGAGVIVSPNWGHNYAVTGANNSFAFPYPAWLIEPSNRYHWGTDWQGQGYDNALAALDFVAKHTPGLSGASERSRLQPDMDRLLITGHSMGGHGCLVFSAHEPDRLLASACTACWTSQRRYVSTNTSPLRGAKLNGILQSRMSEHDADFLSSNIRGVPMKMVYGEDDEDVPAIEPQYMQQLVDSYSGNQSIVELSELPHTPHWFTQNIPELVSFYKRYLPAPSALQDYALPMLPETFEFVVASPSSFGTKGNLQLLQLADASKPARFFVRRCTNDVSTLDGSCGSAASSISLASATAATVDSVWYVETFNVRRFRFAEHLVRGRPLPEAVVLDGNLFNRSSFEAAAGSQAHFCSGQSAGEGKKPHWGICQDGAWASLQRGGSGSTSDGPLGNVLRRAPLCIIHGDTDTQRLEARYLSNKLYFVSRYAVPIVDASLHKSTAAKDYLPDVCSDANVIFIGDPKQNILLDGHRCSFPYVHLHDSDRGFTLAGMSYNGSALGLMALGRLTNGHLALLLHGTDDVGLSRAVARVPVSAFVDAADFLVLGPDAGWEGLGGALAGGYLDNLWRPSASGSWAEPEHSVKRWLGRGFDESLDARCADRRQLLEQSDAEVESFSSAWRSAHVAPWPMLLVASILIVQFKNS